MGWAEFEWDPESLPALKLGLHIAQFILAFIVFALEISVFKDDKALIVGNNGWTFGVCFLSIPAWIYLCMAPRFPRTRKLANPIVMACIDGLYAVFWLSGFASQAAYNTANSCGGACGRSKAIVGLAFIVFLLFCGTTVLSIYTVKFVEWNNRLPGYENTSRGGGQNIDPDKAAFSLAPHGGDEEAYAHVPMDDDHDDHHHRPYGSGPADPYTGLGGGGGDSAYDAHAADTSYGAGGGVGRHPSQGDSNYEHTADTSYGGGRHPSQGSAHSGRPENPFRQDDPFDDDHSYGGAAGVSSTSFNMPYVPPAVHEDFDDDRPVQFPAANYDKHL